MKEHFCSAEKSLITYEGSCNWCGESEGSMTQQELIKRLETTCFGLDPIDPLRLLVDDVIAALTQPERTWVGLTNDELTDLFYNTNLGQQSAVAQAIALLKQKNGFAEEKNT
jgi:hypothetical protein